MKRTAILFAILLLSGDEKIEAYRKVFRDEIAPRLRKKRCRSLEQAAPRWTDGSGIHVLTYPR